jgi:hypothetical protein
MLCVAYLLSLLTSGSSALELVVHCTVLAAANPKVIIDVPTGSVYVARCQHDAIDPMLVIPTTVAIDVQFRCGPGSTLVLDGWQQRNGSLKILPPSGPNAVQGVRVETRGRVVIESTTGHALSFVAATVNGSTLAVGSGAVLRGIETAASFVAPSSGGSITVHNSSIVVGNNSVVSTQGYAAAAMAASDAGVASVELVGVSLRSDAGSLVEALGSDPTRQDYVAALGATGSPVWPTVRLTRCTPRWLRVAATGLAPPASLGIVRRSRLVARAGFSPTVAKSGLRGAL